MMGIRAPQMTTARPLDARCCKAGLAVAAGLLVLLSASDLAAQAPRQCLLQYESPTGNTRTTARELPSKRYDIFQGGGVTYHCQGQDNTITADSAEYYGDLSVLFLIGSVRYSETRAKVNSQRMTYYQLEDLSLIHISEPTRPY